MQVEQAFENAMKTFGPFEKRPLLGVALSGGADSMALCFLANDWAKRRKGKVIAFIVDHQLRSCSRKEALTVAQWCQENAISYEILTVTEHFSSRIEEKARQERYRLLAKACADKGCLHLLTGHHADDQAETVIMRSAKKSGVFGLAGITPCLYTSFGRILRPLLTLTHQNLCDFNREKGICWLEDETNFNLSNERSRLRKNFQEKKRQEALQTAEKSRKKRLKAEKDMSRFIARFVTIDKTGVVIIPKKAFLKMTSICFGLICRYVGQKKYVPNELKTKQLLEKIVSKDFKGASLGGCFVFSAGKKDIFVCKEENNLAPDVFLTDSHRQQWDMWTWVFSTPQTGVLRALKKDRPDISDKVNLPKRCFFSLPSFFNKQGLFLVPHLGYNKKENACRLIPTPKNPVCPHSLR